MYIFKEYKDYRQYLGGKFTNVLNVPHGTTAQRPASGDAFIGSFRYNETLDNIEFFNGSIWKQPAGSNINDLTLNQVAVGNIFNKISGSSNLTFDNTSFVVSTGNAGSVFKIVNNVSTSQIAYNGHNLEFSVDVNNLILSLSSANVKLPQLTGTITDMVVISPTGILSRQAIPVGVVYTDEQAQDAIGNNLGATSSITFNYNDASNLISASVVDSYINTLADARITLQKAQPNGLATLNAGGVIPNNQLPPLAITTPYPVASQVAMLALSAETGDVAIRSDLSKSFILGGTGDPSVLANWLELRTPTDAVTSVNGQTGVVSLTTTNINEGTNLYYTDERAQDAVAAMIAAGTHSGITFSYNDAGNSLSATVTGGGGGGVTDHGALTGLADDDHPQYALLAGRSGGQSLIGGTGVGENLTLRSNSSGTPGKILFGNSGNYVFDGVNGRFGIGQSTPLAEIHIEASGGADRGILIKNTGTGSGDTAAIKFSNTTSSFTLFLATASGADIAGFYTQAPQGFGVYNSSVQQLFKIGQTGNVSIPLGTLTITNLAGTGTRNVVTDNTGLLTTQALFGTTNVAANTVYGNFTNGSTTPSFNAATSDGQLLVRRAGFLTFGPLVSGDIVGGSNNYIQNQITSAQTVANAWISGIFKADSSFITGATTLSNGGGFTYITNAGVSSGGFKFWADNASVLVAHFNYDKVVTFPGNVIIGSGDTTGMVVGNKQSIIQDVISTAGTQIVNTTRGNQTVGTTGLLVAEELYLRTSQSTGNVADIRTFVTLVDHASPGTITDVKAGSFGGIINNASSGTITNWKNIWSQISSTTGSNGTISNFYGFFNEAPGGSGSLTITNRWAFYNNDASASSLLKGSFFLPSLSSGTADKVMGYKASNGEVVALTVGAGLALSSNTLSVSGFVTNGANVGSGIGTWYDLNATTLRFKSFTASTMTGVAQDGGITLTDNSTSIDIKNSEFDVAGKNRFSSNSSSFQLSGKLFQNLPATSAGIIEVQISAYDTISTGSWTTIRRISFRIVSGVVSLGAPSTDKIDENLGTFGTPSIGWTTLNGWPELTLTPANSNLTLWNVSYNVSLVKSDL
jgi:hypothetical protein